MKFYTFAFRIVEFHEIDFFSTIPVWKLRIWNHSEFLATDSVLEATKLELFRFSSY